MEDNRSVEDPLSVCFVLVNGVVVGFVFSYHCLPGRKSVTNRIGKGRGVPQFERKEGNKIL